MKDYIPYALDWIYLSRPNTVNHYWGVLPWWYGSEISPLSSTKHPRYLGSIHAGCGLRCICHWRELSTISLSWLVVPQVIYDHSEPTKTHTRPHWIHNQCCYRLHEIIGIEWSSRIPLRPHKTEEHTSASSRGLSICTQRLHFPYSLPSHRIDCWSCVVTAEKIFVVEDHACWGRWFATNQASTKLFSSPTLGGVRGSWRGVWSQFWSWHFRISSTLLPKIMTWWRFHPKVRLISTHPTHSQVYREWMSSWEWHHHKCRKP